MSHFMSNQIELVIFKTVKIKKYCKKYLSFRDTFTNLDMLNLKNIC